MKLSFCVACGVADLSELEHHHLIPKSKGGSDDETNLITLCHACHGNAHGHERRSVRKLIADGLAAGRAKSPTGKCGGRKSYAERNAAMVAAAKKLARYPINGRKRSLREIAAELEAKGFKTETGKQFAATAVARMLA